MNSELAQLGKNSLVRRVEKFFQRLARVERLRATAKIRERNRAEELEASLDLLLDDIAEITGLNRKDPRVLAAAIEVVLERTAEAVQSKSAEESEIPSVFGGDW